jgi:hypothetical protein
MRPTTNEEMKAREKKFNGLQINPLHFTEVKSLSDLFVSIVPYDANSPMKHTYGNDPATDLDGVYWCQVTDATNRRKNYSLHVCPTAEIREYMSRNMLYGNGIYFQIVLRAGKANEPETALVTATYDQIIGSHWLAEMTRNDIPTEREIRIRDLRAKKAIA